MSSILNDFKEHILPEIAKGSEREISSALVEDMRKWSDPPKALEILYSLDINAYGALSSPFVTRILNMLLEEAQKAEGVTYQELCTRAEAMWRKDPSYPSPQSRPTF
jgi:hypothetical protein